MSLPSVGVLGEVFTSDSDCEIVKAQFSSFSRKRRAFHMESEEDMNVTSPAEDVQRVSGRRTPDVDCGVSQSSAVVALHGV